MASKNLYLAGIIIGFAIAILAVFEFIFNFWGHSLLYFIVQIGAGLVIGIKSLVEYKKL